MIGLRGKEGYAGWVRPLHEMRTFKQSRLNGMWRVIDKGVRRSDAWYSCSYVDQVVYGVRVLS